MTPEEIKEEIKNISVGRPRKWDRRELARKMLEWAIKDDSLNLNGFCASLILDPTMVTRYAREDEEFRLAYDATKAIIGKRREEKLTRGELHVKAYDLNATVYDRFLKEERQDQMRYEASLKTEISSDPQSENAIERLMNFLRDSQSSSKNDCKSKSTESTS